MNSTMNRLANVNNPYQDYGRYRRVLCVCSAGLLRSPTIAYVLAQEPYNCNTRAAGISEEYALVKVDDALVEWADEIVCANSDHYNFMVERYPHKNISDLRIPDHYGYRDPELIAMIKARMRC